MNKAKLLFLLLLLWTLSVGCGEDPNPSQSIEPKLIIQFIDNMDGCTPEFITVEVDGEIYPTADLSRQSELFVYKDLNIADVYFDLEDSVCGDSTVHTQIKTTDQARVYPFYY